MAEYVVQTSKRATLSGTTPDVVRLAGSTPKFQRLSIANESDTEVLTVSLDGTNPARFADNSLMIPPSTAATIGQPNRYVNQSGHLQVYVIGDGNTYIVQLI